MNRRNFLNLLGGAIVAAAISINLKEPLELVEVDEVDITKVIYPSYVCSNRRTVFYQYPNGTAPLVGLLSMLPATTNDEPKFVYEI